MALTTDKGLEVNKDVFDDLLQEFKGVVIKKIDTNDNTSIIAILYELNGEIKSLYIFHHTLLAACKLIEPLFKNPSESLLDSDTSDKTLY